MTINTFINEAKVMEDVRINNIQTDLGNHVVLASKYATMRYAAIRQELAKDHEYDLVYGRVSKELREAAVTKMTEAQLKIEVDLHADVKKARFEANEASAVRKHLDKVLELFTQKFEAMRLLNE